MKTCLKILPSSILVISLVFPFESNHVFSKKNLWDSESTRDYQRGTFLIVLANPDFYDRLEYSAIGYDFVDFKKTNDSNEDDPKEKAETISGDEKK